MSSGFYLASDWRIDIRKWQDTAEPVSLATLQKQPEFIKPLADLEKALGFDFSQIDPHGKNFVLLEDKMTGRAFDVSRDRYPGVIAQYTSKKYIYYLTIQHWHNFYPQLADFLLAIGPPFELWLIAEDQYEPADLESVTLQSCEPTYLATVFGRDAVFLNPIVALWN